MSKKKKLVLSLLVGIGISIAFVWLLLRGVDAKEGTSLMTVMSHIDWRFAALAAAIYLFGHYLRGIRNAWILHPYHRLSFWNATQIVWIGYAANNVLPARLGEFFRAYVLTHREKVPYGISLSTLLVERILDGLAIVGLLFVAASYAPHHPFIEKLAWVAGAIFAGAMAVVLLARLWSGLFRALMAMVCQWLPAAIGGKIEGFGQRLLEGMACLQWDKRLPGILVMSVLIWIVEGGMFLVMLKAFSLPMTLLAAYLAMTITNLGVLVPSTPSNMGTFHYFCTKGLLLSGAITASTTGLGYAIALHALQVIPVTLLGLWALYSYGFNLSVMWREEETEPQVAPQEAELPAHSDGATPLVASSPRSHSL